jgi:hypothetical protein
MVGCCIHELVVLDARGTLGGGSGPSSGSVSMLRYEFELS